MQNTTELDIKSATERYAKALTADLIAKKRITKSQVEQQRTHHEVVLSWQDLQALRLQSN